MPYKDKNKEKEAYKKWKENNHEKVLLDKKIWYANNKERHNTWRINNPEWYKETQRKSVLRRCYGITPDEYNRMFDEQEGCCAICGIHQSKVTNRLNVDHDHITNKVRGLLCWNCNTILGKVNDDIRILRRMICYLRSFQNG